MRVIAASLAARSVNGIEFSARCRIAGSEARMVVRTAERIGPILRPARVLGSMAVSIAGSLAAIDTADRARRNALAASVELSSAAAERRKVDAFLADYASARTRSLDQAS